ncbi:MAG: KilA-N domain-containing protein [Stenotrophomonas sp.]
MRQDEHGRFCLNDLHVASGEERRHQIGNWIALDQTGELVAEISKSCDSMNKPISAVRGRYGGTYAVKELVYAYAMWVTWSRRKGPLRRSPRPCRSRSRRA